MERVTTLPRLPARPKDAHKASVGKVAVMGGSRDLNGAPTLSALGALRAGAGLVRIAVPRSIQPVVAGIRPEATTAGLPETPAGSLAPEAVEALLAWIEDWDVLCLGPGAGREEATLAMLRLTATRVARPLVLDADGLFSLGTEPERLVEREQPTVLTPHEGEAARLLGTRSADVKRDREATAVTLARRSGSIAVLKGPGTLVTDGERLWRCGAGGPHLASGGTGDVLTGVIGALLAGLPGAGDDAFGATCLGVHLHARAGDLVAAGRDRGILASEVADRLPDAVREALDARIAP